jgi:hypothetical protein
MNKYALIIILFFIGSLVTYYSNEYFEDKIWNSDKKVLGIIKEERFFLPFPKEYQLVSSNSDQRNSVIVITVKKSYKEISEFYQEILRSKGYEKDYEYEKDNIIEFRYLKENEDLKISITQELDNSIVEFNYHK